MKKIRIFLLFFVITLLISSCEKNFDPKIYGFLSTANFPKTEADYEALMMDCYLPFLGNWNYSLSTVNQYGFYIIQGVLRLFDDPSDYCAPWLIRAWGGSWIKLSQANYADCILYPRTGGGDDTPNFEKVKDITRMTQIIGVLQDATILSDAKKSNFIGEARLLRGLTMYYLLHIYGPVPVIIDPTLVSDENAEENMVRPTLEQMAGWIKDDFEFAAANMSNTAPKGRYTSDYAKFCLMRHCLNEGSYMTGYYDRAIELFGELRNSGYSLFTKDGADAYANQFKMANKFNNEVIMALSTSKAGDGGGKNGNFFPVSRYVIPNDAAAYADVANTIPTPFVWQGSGWGQCFNVAPAYYDAYEVGDTRRNVILTSYVVNDANRTVITRSDIVAKWSGFLINKYPPEIDSPFQPTDFPLARWADVLLMYAESVARKTQAVPTGDALQGVNDVRARAGLPPLSGTAIASYDGFMDALLIERGHEMIYEGCRKIDLIRFNKYRHNCTIIKGIAPTNQYMPLPDYAVQQAASYGKTLEQYFERPGYASDI